MSSTENPRKKKVLKVFNISYAVNVQENPPPVDDITPGAATYQAPAPQQVLPTPLPYSNEQKLNNESPVNVPVSRSLSARAKRFYEARRRPDSGAGCLAVMLAFLVIFGLLFFIYYTDMNSDDKKGKLKTANVRLMTHPDFQSLLETHVMGDVFLVDDQNKIGVINDNFGPGRQEHTHRFGLKEATVVCKQSGFGGAIAYTVGTLFRSKLHVDYIIEDLQCQGTEENLNECQFVINPDTDLLPFQTLGISGVVCKSGDIVDTKAFLVNGTDNSNGNVLIINQNGLLGPICDDYFGPKEASVICKQLGYEKAKSYTVGSFYGEAPYFAMDDVKCSGKEKFLQSCQFKFQDDCGRSEGAGVVCKITSDDQSANLQKTTENPITHFIGCQHLKNFDGKCDQVNNNPFCQFDGGDCIEDCDAELRPLLGDGQCNEEANIAECQYDAGDCCSSSLINQPGCSNQYCRGYLMSNGVCDEINNTPQCAHDGLDCITQSCTIKKWIGDGICDDFMNTDICDYDGGDCCGLHVNSDYCHDCLCKSEESGCDEPGMHDGHCNVHNNKTACGYDGGDCLNGCQQSLYFNGRCDLINNQTECNFDVGECLEHQVECQHKDWIGDGKCQDINNTPECNYDGWDCCHPHNHSPTVLYGLPGFAINIATPANHNMKGLLMPPDQTAWGFDLDMDFCHDCICHTDCQMSILHNYVCDEVNNKAECNFDGGDCSICQWDLLTNGQCDSYNNKSACQYDNGECTGECIHIWNVGDGECDIFNNKSSCGYDGGDCINCADHQWYGDGLCDTFLNNLKCNFDGGDCTCEEELMGDGHCDSVNQKAHCGNDGGDCNCFWDGFDGGDCGDPECPYPSWIADGICDMDNNNPECDWDGDDCCSTESEYDANCCMGITEVLYAFPDYNECTAEGLLDVNCACVVDDINSCTFPERKGDGICDLSNNNLHCLYDGGDCDNCNEEYMNDGKCHFFNNHTNCNFDGGDCLGLDEDCQASIGDGFCDMFVNNERCHYDGGECCDERINPNGGGDIVPFIWCPECGFGCVDPDNVIDNVIGDECLKSHWIGDGFCDIENNNPECNWDGQDCCSPYSKYVSECCPGDSESYWYETYSACTFNGPIDPKCSCVDDTNIPTCTFPDRKGDGVCDLSNNNEQCHFDGGDCDKCQDKYMNDGRCHFFNNHTNCDFDGGDCLGLDEDCQASIGNGFCDIYTNNERCHFDGGECCDKRFPEEEFFTMIWCPECGFGCVDPAFHSKPNLTPGCDIGGDGADCHSCLMEKIGDGHCDEPNNKFNCDFDGGDCCDKMSPINIETEIGFNMGMDYQYNINVISYCVDQDMCEDVSKVGDGICDNHLNKMSCNFDAGDCCNDTTAKCIDFPVNTAWFDDGYCDEALNTEMWEYDGKDCCTCDEVGPGVPCTVSDDLMKFCDTMDCVCKRAYDIHDTLQNYAQISLGYPISHPEPAF